MIYLISGFILLSFSFFTAVAKPTGKVIGHDYSFDEEYSSEEDLRYSKKEIETLGIMLKKLGVNFDSYSALTTFNGRSVMPDFRGRDKKFSHYRTRIRDMMKISPNFGQKYSLIRIGCGSGCSTLYVGDHSNGRIYQFPRGAEENLVISVYGRVDSNLLIIRWFKASDVHEGISCFWEAFEWRNNKAQIIRQMNIKDFEICV